MARLEVRHRSAALTIRTRFALNFITTSSLLATHEIIPLLVLTTFELNIRSHFAAAGFISSFASTTGIETLT